MELLLREWNIPQDIITNFNGMKWHAEIRLKDVTVHQARNSFPANAAYYEKFVSKKVRLLNDGNIMPIPAYGTVTDTIQEVEDVPQAVFLAIQSGYRHIDTAAFYANEDLIGQAIYNATSCGIVKREELFVTTKLGLEVTKCNKVVPALELALKRLQLDYVDLFLIHTPNNPMGNKKFDLLDIWCGMEEAKKLGLTKSIGVSNFNIEHIDYILSHCTISPAVNQIEVNPTFTNTELVEYCQNQGIIVMAYAPFGFTVPRPRATNCPPPSLVDPVLVKIAEKYGVCTSQVVLRFSIDCGTVPIPRSTNKEHIRSNIDLFSFSLTAEEVDRINGFNVDRKVYNISPTRLAELYLGRIRSGYKRNKKLYPKL